MTIPPATTPAKMNFGTSWPNSGANSAGTTMLTGHTASQVSRAIFHRGGGGPGERNQASSPSSRR